MYDWDDILIVGDSFCYSRSTNNHWPKLLLTKLTGIDSKNPRGEGHRGCSWWSIRNSILKEFEIKIPKILIILHTEYSRFPCDQNRPINAWISAYLKTNNISDYHKKHIKFYESVSLYYEYLYSPKYHEWAQRSWYNELDDLLDNYKIEKVLHIFSILNDKKYHKFRNGVTITDSLEKYSNEPLPNLNTHLIEHYSEKYPNHLTTDNNQKLSISIENIITNKYIDGATYTSKIIE